MGKFRSFCIVIHNVRPDCKPTVVQHVSGAKRSAVALEPYPDQDGFHVHIQVEYANQRHFNSVLKEFQGLSQRIVSPRPDGEERSWGRVQCDQMRGTFEQATAYLTNPRKSKPVDGQVAVDDPDARAREFMLRKCRHGYYEDGMTRLSEWCMNGCVGDIRECQICDSEWEVKMMNFRKGLKNSMLGI